MSDYVTGIHKVTGSRDGYSTRKKLLSYAKHASGAKHKTTFY